MLAMDALGLACSAGRCFEKTSPIMIVKFFDQSCLQTIIWPRSVCSPSPLLSLSFAPSYLIYSVYSTIMHRAITSSSRASALSSSSLSRLGSGRNLQQLRFAHKVSPTLSMQFCVHPRVTWLLHVHILCGGNC